MSRTQNIKRNLIFNIIKYIAQLVLQFVLRTVLIYVLGAKYVGLNGLFSNIFQFLTLAELGVGSAIIFAMYKPIAENDIERIKSLLNLYKRFYFYISIIICVVGLVLLPALPSLTNGDTPENINIYIIYSMSLFDCALGYFAAHKRSLLTACERNDVDNKVRTVCLFFSTIIKIIVLLVLKNYYAYFIVGMVSTLVEGIMINIIADRLFPQLKGKAQPVDKETKKSLTKNVASLSIHKIGTALVFSTDNIIISSIFGLTVLGYYSNYSLVVNSITIIFTLLTNALTGSVGNLIVSNDKEYCFKKFKQINFIFSYLSNFCVICLFVLLQPFMRYWTPNENWVLGLSSVFWICLGFYLMRQRTALSIFKDCAGLFTIDTWKPIVESIVNIGVSIGLAFWIGIDGVFIGTVVSIMSARFWVEPYVVYKHIFGKSCKSYFLRYALDVVIMVASCAICYFVCGLIPEGGLWLLIAKFAVCIVLSNILLLIAYSFTPEFHQVLNEYIKPTLSKIFKKKKQEEKSS